MKTFNYFLLAMLVIGIGAACTKDDATGDKQQEEELRKKRALENTLLGEWTEVSPTEDGCILSFRNSENEKALIFYRNIYEGYSDTTACSYEVISGELIKFVIEGNSSDYNVIVSGNDRITIKDFIAVNPDRKADIVLKRMIYNDDTKEEPKDISFTEYLLSETSCQWKSFPYNIDDTVAIINNKEDLEKYFECMGESNYPVIDFSTHTLLFAHGIAPSSVLNAGCSSLQQISEHNYRMKVDMVLGSASVISNWQVPVIINKLSEEYTVGLIVTIK